MHFYYAVGFGLQEAEPEASGNSPTIGNSFVGMTTPFIRLHDDPKVRFSGGPKIALYNFLLRKKLKLF